MWGLGRWFMIYRKLDFRTNCGSCAIFVPSISCQSQKLGYASNSLLGGSNGLRSYDGSSLGPYNPAFLNSFPSCSLQKNTLFFLRYYNRLPSTPHPFIMAVTTSVHSGLRPLAIIAVPIPATALPFSFCRTE